jgi:hypothetical protein
LDISFTSLYFIIAVLLPYNHNITNSNQIQPIIILLRWYNMPPTTPIQPSISVEWAESLIGLSMKVLDHWWDDYHGYKLHDGKIVSFDIDSQKWNLLLDTGEDGDDLYLMAYSAVYESSDEESSTFDEYHLKFHAVLDGDEAIESAQGIRYTKTPASEWNKVEDGEG